MIKSMHMGKRSVWDHLIAIFLVLIILFIVYRLWEVDIRKVPFSYSVDGLTELTFTKCMIEEGGFGYTSDRLGAPFGYASYDASQSDYLSSIVKKIVSLFSPNPILVINVSYLAGFLLIASVSLAVLKSLDMDDKAAIICSVLFSCAPYHFGRGMGHFSLSCYVAVPIAVYYIIKMMQGNILEKNGYKGWGIYILSMIVIGISGVYYAFFTCFFFCAAALYILINEKNIRRIKEVLLSIFLITVTVVLGYMPTLLYCLENGKNENGIIRSAQGIELYSLKISQLIMPITGHRISLLAHLKNKYNQNYTINENDVCSLGLLFSIGFIVLLLLVWKKQYIPKRNCLHELSCLNMAAILYATVGGFINVQGIFFDRIRCGNRISIFIAFFSCICTACLFSGWMQKRKPGRTFVNMLLLCLLAAGIYDQTRDGYLDVEGIFQSVEVDRDFVKRIEEKEAGNGMILQLPVMQYPESGGIKQMGDYAHLIGYLYSDDLRWSYGAFRGRKGSGMLEVFEEKQLQAEELALQAAKMGYAGIYIDRKGYDEAEYEQLVKGLFHVLNCDPIKSRDENKIYFSLKDYTAEKNVKQDYCSLEFGNGVYGKETSQDREWRWVSQKSQFWIYNWSSVTQRVRIMLQAETPVWEESHMLTIQGEERHTFQMDPGESEQYCLELDLDPGFHSFEVYTDAPLVEAENDSRELCYMLTDYKVELIK